MPHSLRSPATGARFGARFRVGGRFGVALDGRQASIAAIAAGVAVFVVAALISPLDGSGGADAAGAHQPRRHTSAAADTFVLPTSTASTAAPVAAHPAALRRATTRTPAHPPKSARVDATYISGLAANGIPTVALNAYRVAAARMANVDPGCGIKWPLLAGIGREESDHGQFGGAVLHADGISTPEIIGPALTGKGNRFIPAPANGLALDGDAKYAHALGPMQFIPSTWAIYGVDADGDGKADIFDINDAALATAHYLCVAGGNLRTRAARVRAVFAYNHTDVYVAQVLALADAYRKGITVTGIPNGITTGMLPKVGDPGYLPPANPGTPTALQKAKAKQKAHQRAHRRHRKRARTHPKTLAPPPSSTAPGHGSGGSTSAPPTLTLPSPTPTPTPTHTKTASPTPSPTSSAPSSSSSCILGIVC